MPHSPTGPPDTPRCRECGKPPLRHDPDCPRGWPGVDLDDGLRVFRRGAEVLWSPPHDCTPREVRKALLERAASLARQEEELVGLAIDVIRQHEGHHRDDGGDDG